MTSVPNISDLPFGERLKALGVVPNDPPALAAVGGNVIDLRATSGDTPYGLGALRGLCDDIAHAGISGGRDVAFNRACLRVGELIRRGDLTRATGETALRDAGLAVTDSSDFTEYKVDEKLLRVIDQGIGSGYTTRRAPAPELAPELRTFTPDPKVAEQAQQADREFWDSRPALAHIREFARARMTSPWAVLGVSLARVIVTAKPHLVLPPIVGSHASLNLFIALVGPSGGGKGAAESAATDALDLGEDIYSATVGSGEGIGHLYAHRERSEVIRDRDAVLFTVPEVDNLVALGARQGATLMPQLRSAWSGERLGFSYADQKKALPLDRHTYRMGLILGVQPGRAQPLLDDADGGTPQRFLWLPTSDPNAPERVPDSPKPLIIPRAKRPVFATAGALVEMPVADIARKTIIDNRRARLRGDGDALDGHSLLARLKAAAALGLLDQRQDVNDHDWHLAGLVMAISDHTRESVVGYLRTTAAKANEAKGISEAHRAVTVAEHVNAAATKRCAHAIGKRLKATDGDPWIARSDLRRALASRDRQHFEDAIDALNGAGQLEIDGPRIRWKDGDAK
jgi:hypothetical protein